MFTLFVRVQFQLTASQGGWRIKSDMYGQLEIPFQLTASQGGWPIRVHAENIVSDISTHSLTRRLTSERFRQPSSNEHFNSQPHKEADADLEETRMVVGYFNSQPHKEADLSNHIWEECFLYFNSQPHKEADLYALIGSLLIDISTHSLTRRLTCQW